MVGPNARMAGRPVIMVKNKIEHNHHALRKHECIKMKIEAAA